jgi:hypothetical protein
MHVSKWVILLAVPALLLASCNDDDGGTAPGDVTPPAAITDLAVTDIDENTATLAWIAPGDDGSDGTAATYSIRYSRNEITSANWGSATAAASPPTPGAPGTAESFIVTGLSELTIYHFAAKTADEVPNWSGLSNVVTDTTLGQRSLIVASHNGPSYVIFDPTTGADSVRIFPAVQYAGEKTLGYQGRHVILHSPVSTQELRVVLYICDTFTGDNLQQLTDPTQLNVGALDGSPVEPKVAFGADDEETGHCHVYVIGEDGQGLIQLTEQDEPLDVLDPFSYTEGRCVGASQPAWSPDGTQIAYDAGVREVPSNFPHNVIAVMNSDGSGNITLYDRQVEEAHYDDICWTADGNYILFITGSDVKAISVATGTVYDLTNGLDRDGAGGVESITASPHDMTIACSYSNVTYLHTADLTVAGDVISVSSTPTQLTDLTCAEPDWAPYVPEF